VVRIVRTRLRRRRLVTLLGLALPEPVDLEAVAAPEADPEARALLAQVYALLQSLPADERIAWTLRHVERHRLESVAELTSCSLATAKRRIQRAQRYLDARFVSPFGGEEAQ
jgi:RNA polymerase sigma-70 factor (ECF subfamily)